LPEDTDRDWTFPYVDIGNVTFEAGITGTELVRFADAPSRARRRVRNGDTIVSTVRTYLRAIAPVSNQPDGLIASTGFAVIRARPPMDAGYLSWALRSNTFVESVVADSVGVSYPAIAPSVLGSLPIPAPPPAEQRAIADFLDRETAKIDALIATQERLIALLDEKRQATITHAVTKGLDPNAPMKESEVPLVGLIPQSWQVVRLRHLANVQNGIALGRKAESITSEIPYLRVANVQDGYLDLSEVKTIPVTHEEMRRHALKAGDVLMNEGGDKDKLGRGAIWRGEVSPCIHQNHVFAVRPHGVDPEWLTTITGSNYAKCFFDSRGKQTTNLASISSSNLQELPVIMPPDQERHLILQYLGQRLRSLDALHAKVGASMTHMRERRTALITAAVTGQIDVSRPAITEATE
jgi:type I restriction enzyme S subunit